MARIPPGVAALVALGLLAACGDESTGGTAGAGGAAGSRGTAATGGTAGGGGTAGAGGQAAVNAMIDVAALRQSAAAAHSAAQTAVAGDGESAAVDLADVGLSAGELVIPDEGEKSTGATRKGLQGACECTENSCTFADCNSGAGLVLNGSINWTDNSLDCDYSVAGSQAGSTRAAASRSMLAVRRA